MSLGTNIMNRRIEIKLTQREVGEALGVTPSAVTRWESGECYPRGEKLIQLAKVLQCTVGELMDEVQ